MSEYVRITKEGLFQYEWDPETRTWPATKVTERAVISRLRLSCKIDPDVTLGDIFEIVASYPVLVSFCAEYSWCWALSEFHAVARQPGTLPPDIEYMEISRHIDMNTYEDKLNLKPDVEVTLDFGGVGHDGGTHYSCSLTPMNDLAHLPVRLNLQCRIFLNFEVTGSYETWFSLLDILDTIYDDISFHGGPEATKEFSKELAGMIDDVKSGRAKTVPWEPDEETIQ